jgi:23S rRNA pseudouridine2605 synthase
MMRLQKFLARAGVASRRSSERMIASGRVSINGQVITEMGVQVDPNTDIIEVDGARVQIAPENVTIMLNKPAGYITSMSDPQGRKCVAELVPLDIYPALYPVGRLDFDTTGLLLFTTDGQLGHNLLHPSKHVTKTYVATVDGKISKIRLKALEDGIELDDGSCAPAKTELIEFIKGVSGWQSVVKITITEGRKRQVKRMFLAVGHKVLALHRQTLGPLDLGGLECGRWRQLTQAEVNNLQNASAQHNLGLPVTPSPLE